jgi:hypothetical protein
LLPEVTVGDIVAVSEYLDPETGEHKVEGFFSTELTAASDAIGTWNDTGARSAPPACSTPPSWPA